MNFMPIVEIPVDKDEKGKVQEQLREQINDAQNISKRFIRIGRKREEEELDNLFLINTEKVALFFPTEIPEEQELTLEDVENEEDKALKLALDFANQILHTQEEEQGKKGDRVSERLSSLKSIFEVLGLSQKLLKKVKENREEGFTEILKEISPRHKGKSISKAKEIIKMKIRVLEAYDRIKHASI